jgi:hypothetical protein
LLVRIRTEARPPSTDRRAVSELEYSIAKKRALIISQGGRYVEQDHSGDATVGTVLSNKGRAQWGNGWSLTFQ